MRIIWDRKSSETMIVGYWRYVPLAAVLFGALTGTAFFVLVPSLVGFVFGYLAIYSVCFAILAIINYKLARAMNAHFRREAALRPLLTDIARKLSAQSPSYENKEALLKMELLNNDAGKRERPINEMISAMSALPIVGIVFGYAFLRSLTVAQAEHERNWMEFLSLLTVVGIAKKQEPGESYNKSEKSNFAAYLLISLLCFPFLAYWYYDFDKKAERHLREQWQSEDLLAKALQ